MKVQVKQAGRCPAENLLKCVWLRSKRVTLNVGIVRGRRSNSRKRGNKNLESEKKNLPGAGGAEGYWGVHDDEDQRSSRTQPYLRWKHYCRIYTVLAMHCSGP